MVTKLLVAYDDSDSSKKAYSFALDIASKFGADVLVLSVVQPPEPPLLSLEPGSIMENAKKYYDNKFKQLKEQASVLGVNPRFETTMGYPAEQIVRVAKEEKRDMVVMGHKGTSALQEWLVGSVAKRVLTYAPCTVIIVK